ncbi:hypothetical protein M413DRAFT_27502 [Hebeloma cylindrosporum]|uniref:Uncharacterized protein n=1 Tax=Hebeloma cylindrosporum TaxID=76867 RepID=A0A0C3BZF3_HEBCY|nr:hypothetical protein M413DRAFT_27502 [Hebeloma cylindrosporum h7]
MTLINGGRWLLVVSSSGSVSYYDLEIREPVKRLLIPADRLHAWGDYSRSGVSAKIAVDMDNESALLSFNLALYTRKTYTYKTRIDLIQVWHVTLKPDNQNGGSRLVATFLCSFPYDYYRTLGSLSLLGNLVAFGTGPEYYEPCAPSAYVAIVDWTTILNPSRKRHATSSSYLRKIIRTCPAAVQLLPGDMILISSGYEMRFYDTSSIEVTNHIPPASWPRHWPTWRLNGFSTDPRNPDYLRMYSCGNTNESRLVIVSMEGVYGISIPHQSESVPKCVALKEIHDRFCGSTSGVGYNNAVLLGDLPLLRMLYFSWPESSSDSESPGVFSNASVTKVEGKWWQMGYSAFDEISGRVVLEPSRGEKLVVYDFAKFQNVAWL